MKINDEISSPCAKFHIESERNRNVSEREARHALNTSHVTSYYTSPFPRSSSTSSPIFALYSSSTFFKPISNFQH